MWEVVWARARDEHWLLRRSICPLRRNLGLDGHHEVLLALGVVDVCLNLEIQTVPYSSSN